jgi:hypothetical protein
MGHRIHASRFECATFLALIALVCVPCAGAAQSDPAVPGVDSLADRPAGFCMPGSPGDRCAAFPITEFAFNARSFGDRTGGEYQVQWQVGGMVNVSRRDAVGITLVAGSYSQTPSPQWGLSARYRRWLRPFAPLDVAPGFYIVNDETGRRRTRFTTQLSLMARDHFGLFAHVETNDDGAELGGGIKFGSWSGIIIGAPLYLLFALLPST